MTEGIRIGVIDSGINPVHPHAGPVAGGVRIRMRDGRIEEDEDWEDLLGHGTATAATIRGHAPDASLYAIRIFVRRLTAHTEALLSAIDWAIKQRMHLVNLSLGCTAFRWEQAFREVCSRATQADITIVSASETDGTPSLPGVLPDVIGVCSDPRLQDGTIAIKDEVFFAPPWARPLGNLPRERNLQGDSLAVANVTGIIARIMMEQGPMPVREVKRLLQEMAIDRNEVSS